MHRQSHLFIYSSYSLATVRLWRRLHILITKLVLWLLPQVPTGIRPGAVVRFGGVVPRCYPCVCSISRLLFPEPCLLGGHLAGLSSISSSLPLPFLVLFPAFVYPSPPDPLRSWCHPRVPRSDFEFARTQLSEWFPFGALNLV
jgi:hypothetical protein